MRANTTAEVAAATRLVRPGRVAAVSAPSAPQNARVPEARTGAADAPVRAFRPAPPFLYRTFTIMVRVEAVADVIRGFEEVAVHARSERGTRLCAWFQAKHEPTRFLQVLVFDDEQAERTHGESAAARRLARLLENTAAHAGTSTEWNVLAGI